MSKPIVPSQSAYRAAWAAFFVLVIAIAGCNTIQTVSGPVDPKQGEVHGVFYHLPQGLIHITGAYADATKPDGDFNVTIAFEIGSDPRTRYFLEREGNALYDDDFKLWTNGKGLLETVNMTAEDKTADILGDTAGVIAGVLKFAAGLSPGDAAQEKSAIKKPRLPFDYTFSVDELGRINRLLEGKGFHVSVIPVNTDGATYTDFQFGVTSADKGSRPAQAEKAHGIVFRPLVPYVVTVTDQPYADANGFTTQEYRKRAMMPDNDHKLLLTMGRSPFVKRIDNLTFVDGVLTKVEGNRPSVVYGAIQIPKKILTSIVPLPLDLRQTQINNINAERTLEGLRLAPAPTPAH